MQVCKCDSPSVYMHRHYQVHVQVCKFTLVCLANLILQIWLLIHLPADSARHDHLMVTIVNHVHVQVRESDMSIYLSSSDNCNAHRMF